MPHNYQKSFAEVLEYALELEKKGRTIEEILAEVKDHRVEIEEYLKIAKDLRRETGKVKARQELVKRILVKLEALESVQKNVTKD